MILIQDFSFVIGSYITTDNYIFLKAYANIECSSIDTIFQQRDILIITKS